MRSHRYNFERSQAFAIFVPASIAVCGLALALHIGAMLKLLPEPWPALDMDRTILLQKATAARSAQTAEFVLLGDSSSLMDVQARQLAASLGRQVLNLGTLSYIDLPGQAQLLKRYGEANPGRLRTIILLIHPETLRLPGRSEAFSEILDAFLEQRDPPPEPGLAGTFERAMGLDLARTRLLSRVVPIPLPGEFGRYYGFVWDLWNRLELEGGSAVDPHKFDPATTHGSSEYHLANRIQAESRKFRSAVPPGVRLIVGLTPTPASFASRTHSADCAEILKRWAGWLAADRTLDGLPMILPDNWFASVTHLNEEGSKRFTDMLARELQSN